MGIENPLVAYYRGETFAGQIQKDSEEGGFQVRFGTSPHTFHFDNRQAAIALILQTPHYGDPLPTEYQEGDQYFTFARGAIHKPRRKSIRGETQASASAHAQPGQ